MGLWLRLVSGLPLYRACRLLLCCASKSFVLMGTKREPPPLKGHVITLITHHAVPACCVPGFVLDYKMAEVHRDFFIEFWNPIT